MFQRLCCTLSYRWKSHTLFSLNALEFFKRKPWGFLLASTMKNPRGNKLGAYGGCFNTADCLFFFFWSELPLPKVLYTIHLSDQ
jgi:hypothetical protein